MRADVNKRILLVDDSLDHQDLLAEIFVEEGYKLICASNGEEALRVLEEMGDQLPAFILLDLMMPIMDGFKFREVQMANPLLASVPTVLMTADGQVEAKMAQLGLTEVLKKPVMLDQLLNVANRYCS